MRYRNQFYRLEYSDNQLKVKMVSYDFLLIVKFLNFTQFNYM